ncbi:MAG: amidohydrolase/deacetylase family metallohydrolase [Acidobacteriota bacterium]|nr:amidohydrolase/deacetylase family metallohydrolase [Acidobacteriota bacterium]
MTAAETCLQDEVASLRTQGGVEYDLLIKGGRVIDPSQGLDAIRDVGISAGKIACVDSNIPSEQAKRVILASGKVVTPGLIDIHTHVFPYVGQYGIEPDPHCLKRGVTTVIDAGTSGAFTFPAFRRYQIDCAKTRILALLHVVATGMVAGSTPNMGELEDLRFCDPALAVECARANPGVIVGFKIRFSRQYTGSNDEEGMKRARAAADAAGLPVMIHIGGSYSPLETFLSLLKKGDVVTHCFHRHAHGLLDENGRVKDAVRRARDRGIAFDVGHGAGSFSFEVAGKCLEQGFPPETISSDIYSASVNGPVFDLTTTLSKFLLLGMPLPEVIKRSTLNAARAFNYGVEIGTLRLGAEGDVTILELKEGKFALVDSFGVTREARQMLAPAVTVLGGREFYPLAKA